LVRPAGRARLREGPLVGRCANRRQSAKNTLDQAATVTGWASSHTKSLLVTERLTHRRRRRRWTRTVSAPLPRSSPGRSSLRSLPLSSVEPGGSHGSRGWLGCHALRPVGFRSARKAVAASARAHFGPPRTTLTHYPNGVKSDIGWAHWLADQARLS